MRSVFAFMAALLVASGSISAQASLAGNWQGTITFGPQTIRLGLVVTPAAAGYSATMIIIDQDGAVVPVQQVTLTGNMLHLDLPALGGTYDGTLNAAGTDISGAFRQQGMPNPINFKRVEKLDTPPVFDDIAKSAVAAVINAYFQAFTIKDFEAFGATLQAPFTRWPIGGASNVVATVDEVVNGFKMTRQGLEGGDYALSRAAEMIITPLSATSAMVDVHWRRDKKDGSLFQEGAEILTVVKTQAGWKINGNISRALSHYGRRF